MLNAPYRLQLQKFFFIWFSTDAHVSVPTLNKMRLIRAVVDNPGVQLSLVYSRQCLTDKSTLELEQLTCNLGVTLINFDDLVVEGNDLDHNLYQIALNEIKAAYTHQGGNMAAASDCARLLETLHVNYGNYLDLDVQLSVEHAKRNEQYVKWPVQFAAGTFEHRGAQAPVVSNHFLALSRTDQDHLHPEALKRLNHLKTRIVDNYDLKHPEMVIAQFDGIALHPADTCKTLYTLLTLSDSVIQYRKRLGEWSLPAPVYQEFYKNSVSSVSGPGVYYFMLHEVAPHRQSVSLGNRKAVALIHEALREWMPLCGYEHNGLAEIIISQDTAKRMTEEYDGSIDDKPDDEVIGVKTDLSWTPIGSSILEKKSEHIDRDVVRCQATVRGYLTRYKMSDDEHARCSKARDYMTLSQLCGHYRSDNTKPYPSPGQALRRAASGFCSFDTMEKLLKAIIQVCPDVLNEQDNTPASRKTALHHALHKKLENRAQLLLAAGARTDIEDAHKVTARTLYQKLAPSLL